MMYVMALYILMIVMFAYIVLIQGGITIPPLESILSLRMLPNKEVSLNPAYFFFCEHFVKCVVGSAFKDRLKMGLPFYMVATPSDEAFALLLLENNEARLKHEYLGSKSSAGKKNSETKYTGVRDGDSKSCQGWHQKGIERFNELLVKIKANRKKYDYLFEEAFRKYLCESMFGKKVGAKAEASPSILLAKNDLFDDEDSDGVGEGEGEGGDTGGIVGTRPAAATKVPGKLLMEGEMDESKDDVGDDDGTEYTHSPALL